MSAPKSRRVSLLRAPLSEAERARIERDGVLIGVLLACDPDARGERRPGETAGGVEVAAFMVIRTGPAVTHMGADVRERSRSI
jgi:hypothetical protein